MRGGGYHPLLIASFLLLRAEGCERNKDLAQGFGDVGSEVQVALKP